MVSETMKTKEQINRPQRLGVSLFPHLSDSQRRALSETRRNILEKLMVRLGKEPVCRS
jgi:hypothetical protein